MTKRLGVLLLVALAFLFVKPAHAQTVAGSILGTAVDQSGAVVPAANVTLTDTATGATRTAVSDADGVFHFPNIPPSLYTVTINAQGFKQSLTTNIELGQGEIRDLGKVALEVGAITQSVEVTAAVTPVQTSSSEKSTELSGSELNALPLRGRDLFTAVRLVPGVVDTNEGISTSGRDVTSPNAIGGISINGNTSAMNFTVDGITDLDTGSNGTLHFEPNMDSVQEVKVLSSNYQAEFGRNSGGTITVVTKSGTQSFHGSGWWSYRNNWMNANDWFNKAGYSPSKPAPFGISARQKYRYDVRGYSIGGPIYIPGHFNSDKKRLFFFLSQEWTGQYVPAATGGYSTVGEGWTVPTLAMEGVGTANDANCPGGADFSGIVTSSGGPIDLIDPSTGNIFANNCIPKSRIDPQGQKMLEYMPQPNINNAGTSNANQGNFFSSQSAPIAQRSDTLRVDVNPTSKLTAYFRYINNHYVQNALYQSLDFVGNELLGNGEVGNPQDTVVHPNPGHGYAGSAIWTITPTLVNETTVAKDWNTWSWYLTGAPLAERTRNSSYNPGFNPPVLFPLPASTPISDTNGYQNLLPALTYGGGEANEMSQGVPTAPYFNANPIWTVEDNLSKVVGQHQFKMGFYWEHNEKIQPASNAYIGNFSFATNNNNPLSTSFGTCPKGFTCGDGYANAILGYYGSYTQQTARTVFDVTYQNLEFYIQDNWRITRRLTLDLGVRFYHQTAPIDENGTFAEFIPSLYNPAAVPSILKPYCTVAPNPALAVPCPAADQKAVVNPAAPGTLYPASDIGAFVPGTSATQVANGMEVLGKKVPYSTSAIAPGARVGFAYDVFGNGKTAIRGGFGQFFNRLDGNQVYGLSGQPPLSLAEADNFDCMSSASQACPAGGNGLQGIQTSGGGGLFTPPTISPTYHGSNVPWLTVYNASLGFQQNVGFSTVVSVGWSGNFTRHADFTIVENPVPLTADFSNVSPVTGQPLTQNGSSLERTTYYGYQNVSREGFVGYTNYHALNVTAQHRLSKGTLFGFTYTLSKNLGVTAFDPLVPNNNARNYGPESTDRRHNLLINYTYDLPNITRKWDNKFLGFALDNWTFSGLTTFQSGAPITPTFSAGNGADISGSTNEGPRPNYLGGAKNIQAIAYGNCTSWNATAATATGVKYIFNPCAFSAPTQAAAWSTSANGGNGGVVPTTCSLTCYGSETVGDFYGNGLNDFDWFLEKRFPIGKDARRAFRFQFQAYNVWNHPQFITVNSTATFNATFCSTGGACSNNTSPVLVASQAPNNSKFGQATGDTGGRILSLNIRFEF